ncbi:hypothetical protein J2Z40_003622 [Cytobacillus eiseniae]|uniref:Lipoprotein n=1 Tax=Cytobacillus eiseniae TaxID=762947 RepID=A0ABS4RJF7_9BACI|nr:DUF6612 family protein [Cytobacillus eiseniae]MBP2243040.1 hypothetical protein [Cytobacillus eiseniae]
MKKSLSILTGLLLIFMLAACNQTAEPVNEPNEEETPVADKEGEAAEEKASELTLEEVFNKSAEASETLKSFAVQMEMTQEMSSDQEELNMKTSSVIDMSVVTEPMAYYQKMKMSLGEESESFEMESYFSADGMFLYEPESSQWMKFPQEMTEAFLQMAGQQQPNPSEELKKLQQFVEDFTFEQDSSNYILKLKASGDKFNDFIKATAAEQLPPEMALEEVLNNMNVNAVDYEILINKETFYPSALIMNMDMDMTIEGQTISLVQSMNGQYSSYNEIDEIVIPQEVIDSAVDMGM